MLFLCLLPMFGRSEHHFCIGSSLATDLSKERQEPRQPIRQIAGVVELLVEPIEGRACRSSFHLFNQHPKLTQILRRKVRRGAFDCRTLENGPDLKKLLQFFYRRLEHGHGPSWVDLHETFGAQDCESLPERGSTDIKPPGQLFLAKSLAWREGPVQDHLPQSRCSLLPRDHARSVYPMHYPSAII